MKGRRIITFSRFTALFLVAGAFACGGDTEPEPDPNRAPVAVGLIPPLSLVVGQSETVDASQFFSDPDGDQLSYSATSSDTGVLTVSVSGSNVTATAVGAGMSLVTVTATDPDGLSASHMVDVTVVPANESPVVSDTIPPQMLTEGDTVTIDAAEYFSDPDGDALTFAASSSNTDAVTAGHEGSMVTIIAVAEGTATVTVTATDPDNASASQDVMVTVEAANRAPVTVDEIPPLPMTVGEQFSAPVDIFFMDPDGDTLTYAAMSSDTTVVTTAMTANIITVAAVGAGESTITVTATDPEGLSATQTTTATVTAVNRGPTLTDTIPHQEMVPGDTVTLDVSNNFTDPDGDTLTFTAASGDTSVATASVDGSMVTVVAVAAGSAFITVEATDPGGLSAAQTFAAFVASGNRAPEAVGEIPAQTVKVGRTAMVDVAASFTDPDGDELAYTAASSDDAVATASIAGTEVTITGVAAGMATLTVTATDPEGLSAVQEAEVTVAVNQAPEVSDTVPVHDVMIVLDSLDMTMVDTLNRVVLDMSNYFSDPDDAELTYTASTAHPDIAAVESVDGSLVTTVAVSSDDTFAPDTTMLTVTATDSDGLSVTQEARVLVSNSDYEIWDVIEITEEGKIKLVSLGFELDGCFPVLGIVLNDVWYRAEWTSWQVRRGTGWVLVPGTYAELQVCAFTDLPDAAAGTYRLVGEVQIWDTTTTDTIRSRRKSGNEITIEEEGPPPSLGAALPGPGVPAPAHPLPSNGSARRAVQPRRR